MERALWANSGQGSTQEHYQQTGHRSHLLHYKVGSRRSVVQVPDIVGGVLDITISHKRCGLSSVVRLFAIRCPTGDALRLSVDDVYFHQVLCEEIYGGHLLHRLARSASLAGALSGAGVFQGARIGELVCWE